MDDAIPVFLCRTGMMLNKHQQQLLQEIFMTDEKKPDQSGETPGKHEGQGDQVEEQPVDTSGTSHGGDPDSEATGAGPSGGAEGTTAPGGAAGDSSAEGAGPSGGAE